MSKQLIKMAPIGVVAAILGYLCYPYLDDPTAASKSKNSNTAAASLATLLNPARAGNVRENLFEIPQVAERPAPKKATANADKLAAAKKAADARSVDIFKTFVLSGTYLTSGHRYAVINGSLYAEGEQIEASGKAAKAAHTAACTVSHVDIDKVVLSFQGQTKELHYSDKSAPDPNTNSTKKATGSGYRSLQTQ